MNVGYARVSTQGQTLESQLEELGKAGCSKIYSEKISGAKCDRPELQRLLKARCGRRSAFLVAGRLKFVAYQNL